MKKFQFRLERVFRFHQQRLKQAELRVAQAVLEREAANSSVVQIQTEIHQACQRTENPGSLINPAVRANLTAHVEMLGNFLAKARDRLKVAEQRFRETNEMRAKVSQAVEGLSQLREVRREEHQHEVSRLLQIELDEVVMRKWSLRNASNLTPNGPP